jgi:transporter family protein
MWFYYALLSALFAAFTAVFAKIGVANISSNLATGIRTAIIVIMVWSIILIKGDLKGISSLSKMNITFLVLSGVATGLSWLFYFKALQIGKISQVASVDKLSVAIAILLSVLFFKETLTLKTAVGALLIISGTVLFALK